jgi:subtilisin family serine protease
MAFMYSARRAKVELTLSADDVGVRFQAAELATRAARTTQRSLTGDTALHEFSPRAYGRVMLLHESAVARTSFATVRDALPKKLVSAVRRTTPVYIEQQSGLRLVSTREITVRFQPKSSEGSRAKVLLSLGLTLVRPNEFRPNQQIVEPAAAIDETAVLDLANTLSERDDVVAYAAPNFIAEHRKAALPEDPLLPQQWHLDNTGQAGGVTGKDVRALQAWGLVPGGSPNVVIAIIDDGVDLNHPDLKDNIWSNPNPAAPDRQGRNFYDQNYDPSPHYFRPPYDQMEGNDIHGTPCAGVAAAVANRRGGVGLAYKSKILPVKVFGADSLASNDRVADAIRYAGQHAQVISCSWSGPMNPDLESAIDDVTRDGRNGRGCLVFCATGNDYKAAIGFPARHPDVFAIGASNDQGKRAKYSNYGPGIRFVAPSSDPDMGRQGITTTDVSLRNRGFNIGGHYTDDFGGTSSATPLAAAIGALVLSVSPGLSRIQVRNLLQASAVKIDSATGAYRKGYSLQYGFGCLDAFAAVSAAQKARARRTARKKKAKGKARGARKGRATS